MKVFNKKGGSLENDIRQRIMNKLPYSNIEIYKFLLETISSLEYIFREFNFTHLDIKPDNILIGNEGEYKLCDFGTCYELIDHKSCIFNESENSIYFVSLLYASPEYLADLKKVSPTSDIWSLGLCLLCMCRRYDKETFANIRKGENGKMKSSNII